MCIFSFGEGFIFEFSTLLPFFSLLGSFDSSLPRVVFLQGSGGWVVCICLLLGVDSHQQSKRTAEHWMWPFLVAVLNVCILISSTGSDPKKRWGIFCFRNCWGPIRPKSLPLGRLNWTNFWINFVDLNWRGEFWSTREGWIMWGSRPKRLVMYAVCVRDEIQTTQLKREYFISHEIRILSWSNQDFMECQRRVLNVAHVVEKRMPPQKLTAKNIWKTTVGRWNFLWDGPFPGAMSISGGGGGILMTKETRNSIERCGGHWVTRAEFYA